jgi:hypothetical protein
MSKLSLFGHQSLRPWGIQRSLSRGEKRTIHELTRNKANKNGTMPEPSDTSKDLDPEQARLAYSIIQSLLEHTRVVSDLIALMAQTMDEDTTKALTQTPVWTAYLDSRRSLERTHTDVEKFAQILTKMSDEGS